MPELKIPDINNILIAGTLINNPIEEKTQEGTTVVRFNVASNKKYLDNSGIWRENLCHVTVVTTKKLAESCLRILKINNGVLIEGELAGNNAQNEHTFNRNILEIRARKIQYLDTFLEKYNSDELYQSPAKTTEDSKTGKEDKIMKEDIPPTEFDFGYQNLKL